MDAFTAETAFPPSLVGQPVLAMLVTMGFWFGTLLCLQWIYSLVEDLVKNPRPRYHPLTATRAVKLALLFAALSQTVPRLAMLMAWKIMDAEARVAWAVSSWVVYIPWALMFAFAWWIDRQARAAEAVQMSRPYAPQVPLEKGSMTPSQKKRGASIFVMIFVIAFATTYIRPAASDGPPAIIDQRH